MVIKNIPTDSYITTLACFHGEFPMGKGNGVVTLDPTEKDQTAYQILNLSEEDMEGCMQCRLINSDMQAIIFESLDPKYAFAWVIDARIPKKALEHRFWSRVSDDLKIKIEEAVAMFGGDDVRS